jgi:hypothetical protein
MNDSHKTEFSLSALIQIFHDQVLDIARGNRMEIKNVGNRYFYRFV